MMWSQLPGALLPIDWRDIGSFVERFVAELCRPNGKVRPRQLDRLRDIISLEARQAA